MTAFNDKTSMEMSGKNMHQQHLLQEFEIELLEQRVEFGLCGGGSDSGGTGGGGDGCGVIGDCEDHMVNP